MPQLRLRCLRQRSRGWASRVRCRVAGHGIWPGSAHSADAAAGVTDPAAIADPARPRGLPGPLLLVLGAIVSVQFGGAVAATLVPVVGAAGAVVLRLGIGAVIVVALARPRLRGHSAAAWRTVVLFGIALAAMNWSFYGALGRLPIGVAVTIEFIGPLTLAAVLSRRARDFGAVAAAAIGVLLISEAFTVPWAQLDLLGIGLALLAGACWAAYIVMSQRTGAAFPQLDGLAFAMIVAFFVVAPAGLLSLGSWTEQVWVRGALVAVLSSVLPYSLELLALRHLSRRVFGILLSLEPVAAALAGLVVLGQRLDAGQLVGMALVVVASAVVLGARRRRSAPSVTRRASP
ncbi:MAG: EamA family transporter [Actinomycetales bacterium]|nr:MAG: EamA family transporter [Actinomycetales bacterium]